MTKTRTFARRKSEHGMRATQEPKVKRINVLRAFAFDEVHQYAREKFQSEFKASEDSALAEAARDTILRESQGQEETVAAVLHVIDKHELEVLVSHFVYSFLLNEATKYIKKHHLV